MSVDTDLLVAVETHSPDGIRAALAAGASPTQLIKGKTPIDHLVESYLRSPRFADCLRVLIDAGAAFTDPLLELLLLDDEAGLLRLLSASPKELGRRLHVPCAFTSCEDVTTLHVCAEFGCVRCARVLLDSGADVNAAAAIDSDGFGGQTPIFHAVNSIFNYGRPMMELLLEAGADWETTILDVTPISYTQCGLYAQFHRREQDVYENLAYLYQRRHGTGLRVRNVPNKYLAPRVG